MTDEIEQLLKNLQLGRMRAIYDEQLRAAARQQVSYSEFIAALLRAQWHHRQESALEWRIRRANLPERWSLETSPCIRQAWMEALPPNLRGLALSRRDSWTEGLAWLATPPLGIPAGMRN